MPFSTAKAAKGGKREVADGGSQEQPRTSKVPKVSEMKVEPPRQVARTNATNAPVNVVVYKVSDNAGDLWSSFRDASPQQKLFQIQAGLAKSRTNIRTRAIYNALCSLRAGRSRRPSERECEYSPRPRGLIRAMILKAHMKRQIGLRVLLLYLGVPQREQFQPTRFVVEAQQRLRYKARSDFER